MQTLTVADLGRIVALEEVCFIPPVRASEERIRKRLELGHIMVGVEDQGALVGVVSFSFAPFSPDDYDQFPKTHEQLSTQPMLKQADAVFVYNLALDPAHRSLRLARSLLRVAAEGGDAHGCTFAVGNSRMPSYAGSQDYPQESVPASPVVRIAVDKYLAGGAFPSSEQLCHDPLLRFYHRLTGTSFLWLQTEFCPEDRASGGMGMVLYGRLDETVKHLSSPI